VGDLQSFYRVTLQLPEQDAPFAEDPVSGAVLRRLRSGYTEDTRWDPTDEGARCRPARGSDEPPALLLPLQPIMPPDLLQLQPVLLRGNIVFEPVESPADPAAMVGLFGNDQSPKPLHPENFGFLQLCDDAG
jgi:hypothetical protein